MWRLSTEERRSVRRSKLEAAETRRHIVATAAAEFRQHGVSGTSLADLMAAAGLTHGGFYKHFGSRDQLVAEACNLALKAVADNVDAAVAAHPEQNTIGAFAAQYLSPDHRDNPSTGCPLPALGSEIARSDEHTRAVATQVFRQLVDALAKPAGKARSAAAERKALVALSTMVGALMMSRMVNDRELSDSLLDEARNHLARS